jgi:hypothetical protein
MPTLPAKVGQRGGCRFDLTDADLAADLRLDDSRNEAGSSQRQGRFAGAGSAGHADNFALGNCQTDIVERLLAPADIANAQPFDGQARARHRPKTPVKKMTTTPRVARTMPQRSQRSEGGSGTTRYAVRSGRAPKARASSAKVRSRTSMSEPRMIGPIKWHECSHARTERAGHGQSACLLRVENCARPRLKTRHELDGGEDHECEAVAHTACDQRLQQVVRQGREQEEHGAQEDDGQTAGRHDAEVDPLPRQTDRSDRDNPFDLARIEQGVDDQDRGKEDRRDAQRARQLTQQARRRGRDYNQSGQCEQGNRRQQECRDQ